jgi:hypothetical protein
MKYKLCIKKMRKRWIGVVYRRNSMQKVLELPDWSTQLEKDEKDKKNCREILRKGNVAVLTCD